MNILILGGRTNFGEHLDYWWNVDGHKVLAVGRQDLDFAHGWVTPLRELINVKFGKPESIDMIVVNVYDDRRDCSDVQSAVLDTIWNLFRKQRVLIVVMGSLAYHYSKSEYALAKKALASQCYRYSDPFEEARLLLVEPSVLENNRERYPASRWMKYDTLRKLIDSVMHSNFRFLQLAAKGNEPPIPVTPKEEHERN